MPSALTPPAQPLISVILPCLDEAEVLGATLDRLAAMADAQPDCRFEFVFVDDGSQDGTLALLRAAAAADARVRVLALARNFGHQIALTAGMEAAQGEAAVLMDADLQDPPEVVGQMITLWRQGYDVVYARRRSRAGEGVLKRASAHLFYRVLARLSEVPIPGDTGDFRLIGRPVLEALRQMPERHRFLRGMVAWTGFRQIALDYDRPPRFAGTTKFPLRRMLRFAADGILSFSTRPLQISIALGLIAAGLALLGILYALALRLFTASWVQGWTALMIAVLFMGGVQLVSLGILGEYVGRIYDEAKQRPLYIVRERLGFDADPLGGAGPAGDRA